jgi:hypothetical protein
MPSTLEHTHSHPVLDDKDLAPLTEAELTQLAALEQNERAQDVPQHAEVAKDSGVIYYSYGNSSTAAERQAAGKEWAEERARIAAIIPHPSTPEQQLARTEQMLRRRLGAVVAHVRLETGDTQPTLHKVAVEAETGIRQRRGILDRMAGLAYRGKHRGYKGRHRA